MKKEIISKDANIFSGDDFKLVLTIVKRGYETNVLEAAKDAGHFGATILQGKGISKNQKKFFGMNISPENTAILMVVKNDIVIDVINKIYQIVDFKSEAGGMVFALPVSLVAGVDEIDN